MTALERLLSTGYHLVVFQWRNREASGIGVHFKNCEIKDGYFLVGSFGRGRTMEEACEDYIREITGQLLVFNSEKEYRKEVRFI